MPPLCHCDHQLIVLCVVFGAIKKKNKKETNLSCRILRIDVALYSRSYKKSKNVSKFLSASKLTSISESSSESNPQVQLRSTNLHLRNDLRLLSLNKWKECPNSAKWNFLTGSVCWARGTTFKPTSLRTTGVSASTCWWPFCSNCGLQWSSIWAPSSPRPT